MLQAAWSCILLRVWFTTCKLSLISDPLPSLFGLLILQFIQKFSWREGKIWRGGIGDGEAEKCLEITQK